MASRLFFDPLVALRVAPLLSSTCTLLYAWDQDFFLGIMNRPENRSLSKPLLPNYFGTFFRRGVVFVVGVLAATTSSSITNLYARREALHARGAFWWYVAGGVFATGHMLFVPFIAPSCQAIIQPNSDTDVNERLSEWRWYNGIRGWTVDLAAWLALIVATGKSLEANLA